MGEKVKIFIGYETKTGLDLALHLKEALEKIEDLKLSAFVTAENIKIGEIEREKREEAIKNSKYFVVIVTILAPHSVELKKEIKLAREFNQENLIRR